MKNNILLEVKNLKTYFRVRTSFFTIFEEPKFVRAVDDVSFIIRKGEIFGLAGESGSGKTTLGKSIIRLIEPISGHVYFGKQDVLLLNKKELKKLRRKMQMIFQDPYESLNPRQRIFDIIAEPLRVNGMPVETTTIIKALDAVELKPPQNFLNRFPHELSGGQRQRVAIASTLVLEPEFIIADEPVSMLDVSIRSGILRLLLKLKKQLNISFLYITHDLATARYICDHIAIMYSGKIVEEGPAVEVINKPLHPYTRALISVIPTPDLETKRHRIMLKGEPPNLVDPPGGCRFNPRCPHVMDVCRREEPLLVETKTDHEFHCFVSVTKNYGCV